MPRPAYMICSTGGAVDAYTQSLNCFNVVELIHVQKQEPSKPATPLSLRVVATWMKEEGDEPDTVFEAEISARFEKDSEPIMYGQFPTFSFGVKPFHRLILPDIRFPGFPKLGVLLIECRIKQQDQDAWLDTQMYPLLIREGTNPVQPDGK